jgi:pimeloyl-ACP methyl ester carboxylesterase
MKHSSFLTRVSLFVLSLAPIAFVGCHERPPVTEMRDTVVLLHGLGRSDLSMRWMEKRLTDAGYNALNVGYPSKEHSIDYLAEEHLRSALEACCAGAGGKVHFVTHSMGGIVLRYYLSGHELENLGRVVMLSPPNQGSEIADWINENEFVRRVMGPSAEQLGTDPESVPNRLGPVDFEVGIITGNRTLNPLFSRMIPGADDGKVSVESAKVEGMADFLVVAHTHTYIMLADDVVYQTVYFLQNGEFDRQAEEAADSGAAPTADSIPESES